MNNIKTNENNDVNEVFPKFNRIVEDSYISLIFCLILNKDYRMSLHYIEALEKSKISDDLYIKLENYKIKAYFNLGNYNKSLELIKKSLASNKDSKY